MGTACPPRSAWLHRLSTTSGAPLVNCTTPSFVRCSVVIILRMESNGASPTRGYAPYSASPTRPAFAASFTSAHSVGSPMASPAASSNFASLHSAIAVRSSVSSSPACSTTVILFCVSVPVLSEQMICVQPSVSTAVSLRMIAFLLDMFVTPMDSTTVTTAANPSGIAATASDTATMNVSSSSAPLMPALPARSTPTPKITAQMPSTSTVRMRLSWLSLRCSGVCSSAVCASAPAILPISVFMPVPVTTAVPRP